jgi:hypothetical protein
MLYVQLSFEAFLILQCSLVAGRFTSGLHSATFIVSVGAILQAAVLFWLLLFYRFDFYSLPSSLCYSPDYQCYHLIDFLRAVQWREYLVQPFHYL